MKFFNSNKVKVITYKISFLVVIVLFFKVLLISVQPNTVLAVKHNSSKGFFSFTRQGWSFFTKDAQIEKLSLYKIENGISQINLRNSQVKNLFGIIKGDRITNHIIESKYKQLPDSMILELDRFPEIQQIKSLIQEKKIKTITLKNFSRLKKGKYIVAFKKPVPWAWHSIMKKETQMPVKLILFNCI